MAKGIYLSFTATQIQEIADAARNGILDVTARGVTYNIAGRSFTFPTIESCNTAIEECTYALGRLNGTVSTSVRVNFNVNY